MKKNDFTHYTLTHTDMPQEMRETLKSEIARINEALQKTKSGVIDTTQQKEAEFQGLIVLQELQYTGAACGVYRGKPVVIRGITKDGRLIAEYRFAEDFYTVRRGKRLERRREVIDQPNLFENVRPWCVKCRQPMVYECAPEDEFLFCPNCTLIVQL